MKTILARARSYFDKMPIGEDLTIFAKEIQYVPERLDSWRRKFLSSMEIPPQENLSVKEREAKKEGLADVKTSVVTCEISKTSNDLGDVYIRVDDNPSELLGGGSIRIPDRILSNFAKDKEGFKEDVKYYVLNMIPFSMDSKSIEPILFYKIKEADMNPPVLDIVGYDNINLGHGIYARRMQSSEIASQPLASKQLLAYRANANLTPMRDLVFAYYVMKDGKEQAFNAIMLSYSNAIEFRAMDNYADLRSFLIDKLEHKYNLEIADIAARLESKGEPLKKSNAYNPEKLTFKDLHKIFSEKATSIKDDDEMNKLKNHFNYLIKKLNSGQTVTEEDVLMADYSEMEEDENKSQEEPGLKHQFAITQRFDELRIYYLSVTKKYFDAIKQFRKDDKLSEELGKNLDALQSSYELAVSEFNQAKTSEEKWAKTNKINNIITHFRVRLPKTEQKP